MKKEHISRDTKQDICKIFSPDSFVGQLRFGRGGYLVVPSLWFLRCLAPLCCQLLPLLSLSLLVMVGRLGSGTWSDSSLPCWGGCLTLGRTDWSGRVVVPQLECEEECCDEAAWPQYEFCVASLLGWNVWGSRLEYVCEGSLLKFEEVSLLKCDEVSLLE